MHIEIISTEETGADLAAQWPELLASAILPEGNEDSAEPGAGPFQSLQVGNAEGDGSKLFFHLSPKDERSQIE